jgi:hypothetical protein
VEGISVIRDASAIAVNMPHRRWKSDFMLAAVEHHDLVSIRGELTHDARAHEDRATDDENATHTAIVA